MRLRRRSEPEWVRDYRLREETRLRERAAKGLCEVRMRALGANDCWIPCDLQAGHEGVHEWHYTVGDERFVTRFSTLEADITMRRKPWQDPLP